jgi:hypothetical protein
MEKRAADGTEKQELKCGGVELDVNPRCGSETHAPKLHITITFKHA